LAKTIVTKPAVSLRFNVGNIVRSRLNGQSMATDLGSSEGQTAVEQEAPLAQVPSQPVANVLSQVPTTAATEAPDGTAVVASTATENVGGDAATASVIGGSADDTTAAVAATAGVIDADDLCDAAAVLLACFGM